MASRAASCSSRPPAPYFEECEEDDETAVLGTRPSANAKVKRSRPELRSVHTDSSSSKPELPSLHTAVKSRDEASDSGYSSHTAATTASLASSSQGSKTASPSSSSSSAAAKIDQLRAAKKKMASTADKTRRKEATQDQSGGLRGLARAPRKENLRLDTTQLESRESAAKMRLAPTPLEPESASTSVPRPRTIYVEPSAAASRAPPPTTRTSSAAAAQPTLYPRPRPHATQSYQTARPTSYHAGMMPPPPLPGYAPTSTLYYERRPPPQQAVPMNNASYPQSFAPPAPAYLPSAMPTSPNRQIGYAFHPTMMNNAYQPLPPGWEPVAYSPLARRLSVVEPRAIVEYPTISSYTSPPAEQSYARRASRIDSYSPIDLPEEAIYVEEEGEDYYRSMPPPPRPVYQDRPPIRHAATMPVPQPQLPQPRPRSKRDSIDPAAERSQRKASLDEGQRPQSRPGPASRSSMASASSGSQSRQAHPTPTDGPEARSSKSRQRPVSYYESRDLEQEVEAYQAANGGSTQPIRFPAEPSNEPGPQKKTRGSTGSENGSRASSSRGSSDFKLSRTATRTSIDRTTSRSSLEKHRGSSAAKERKHSTDGFTIQFQAKKGMTLGLNSQSVAGRTVSVRQGRDGDGEVQLSIGSKTSSRRRAESQQRDRGSRADAQVRSRPRVKEIGDAGQDSRRSQSRGVSRKKSLPASPPEVSVEDKAEDEDQRAEQDLVSRLSRLKTDSRSSRHSSKSSGRKRPAREGDPF